MSIIPFFPSLKPPIANCIWFDGAPINEEAEILKYEREHHTWLENVKNTASDIHPLGKVLTMIGTETDDEDANDDSDESDSHEDEDDDTIDRAIPGIVERSALGSYSPGDEINLNDDLSAAVVGS
ncbi:anaphase-promoting complex subunit 15-like [Glossina fuscipes]|uniref:Anaphase-promoting complex subunit 15-like n=1 Tax=Glossina fuscipes TaxID=7396 RepID=A0A9C5ZBE4_9MUSC|nr:anaphase-promoting complex subunit 15-like [Glossina fuscipes]XP_037899605.1 anaphase-promoting complex subunit 15-like [Glossina fuscipes]XP_037899700.1 anaphase-promoting complex subunit 15-like [Glossina fuscipes]